MVRTIKSTIAICKCVDMETMDIVDKTFVLGNVPEKKIARTVNKVLKDTNLKLVKIVDTTSETVKYKMSDETFIANAERVE